MFSYNGDLHQTKTLAEDFIVILPPFFFFFWWKDNENRKKEGINLCAEISISGEQGSQMQRKIL